MTITELLEKDAFAAIDWLVENKNDFELVPVGRVSSAECSVCGGTFICHNCYCDDE